MSVLGGVGILLCLDEILDCDEAGEAALAIDEGKFLDLVLGEKPCCFSPTPFCSLAHT